jgi:hypothetical protein
MNVNSYIQTCEDSELAKLILKAILEGVARPDLSLEDLKLEIFNAVKIDDWTAQCEALQDFVSLFVDGGVTNVCEDYENELSPDDYLDEEFDEDDEDDDDDEEE